jgi:tRNA-2-methylthio-N6-dimethylallyladenosine synthase
MSGCTNFCSYCIVPHVRGPERSRRIDELAGEVEGLIADGVREVTLLGQNVNAYGLDLRHGGEGTAPTFSQLLCRLDTLGPDRLRFMTSHPKDLGDDLVAAIAELPSVCEHVHLPAQSGSDKVLRAMRRGYTARRYLERVGALRAAVPDVSITTDLIAGFPGETEEDFERTLDPVREAAFDAAFTFVFSPRPGTRAASLPDQVPPEARRERVERLIELTQQQALASRRAWIGREAEVLVEGVSRDGRLLRGRTRQNVTVNIAGGADPGAIVTVKITAATSTTLRGTV